MMSACLPYQRWIMANFMLLDFKSPCGVSPSNLYICLTLFSYQDYLLVRTNAMVVKPVSSRSVLSSCMRMHRLILISHCFSSYWFESYILLVRVSVYIYWFESHLRLLVQVPVEYYTLVRVPPTLFTDNWIGVLAMEPCGCWLWISTFLFFYFFAACSYVWS